MSPQEIDSLPLQELVDLLVKNTMELIDLTEKRSVDRIIIVSKRSDVKIIRSAIDNKMRVKRNPLLSGVIDAPGQFN